MQRSHVLLLTVLLVVLLCVNAFLFWPSPPSPPPSSSSTLFAPTSFLFNPLEPEKRHRHHVVFDHFHQWHGTLKPSHVTDWLGIETAYEWDCIVNTSASMQYAHIQPARRIPCDIHAAHVKTGVREITGELPVLDDEYEEWVDVLLSVVRTPRDYVVVELGARYGTWGVRALKAWYQLRGTDARATFVGVESDAQFFGWMQDHVAQNGLNHESVLLHQMALKGAGTNLLSIINRSGIDHINYLDTDIQGAELDFFYHGPTLDWMETHVDVVHIGTHSSQIHARLEEHFLQRGWRRFFGYPLGYGTNCEDTVVTRCRPTVPV